MLVPRTVLDPAARAPRALPAREPLSPADHRRLIGVIEAVDRAPDLGAFEEQLLGALQSWFGYTTIAVLHGRTLSEALREGQGIKSGYSQRFLNEYAARWITSDPFLTPTARRLLTERSVVTLQDLDPAAVPAHRRYAEQFLLPHGIRDKMGMVIDSGPQGVVYVGAVVEGAAVVPARDLAVMRRLSRHLAPFVADQLERDHAQPYLRRAWRLTPREREVAGLAAQGFTNQQIAQRLFVGVGTVKKHLTRVLAETGCASRTQLAVRWRQENPARIR